MSAWYSNLKKQPPTKCTACGTRKSYTNPVEKCVECGKRFCFDHIKRGHNNTMSKNDEIVYVCLECFDSKNYKTL